jgi:hypothetical protein
MSRPNKTVNRKKANKTIVELVAHRNMRFWDDYANHRMRNYLAVVQMAIEANHIEMVHKKSSQMTLMHKIQRVRVGYKKSQKRVACFTRDG